MTRAPLEAPIQIAIVAHFRSHYAGRIFHIPNGGRRGRLEAIRFKAMGVEAGVLDLEILNPAAHAFMEVKRVGGALTPAQRAFIRDLIAMNVPYAVVHSLEEAKIVFKAWKLVRKAATISAAEYRTGL